MSTTYIPSEPGGTTVSVSASADDGFAGSWGYSNSATWFEAGNPGGSTYSTWFRFDNVQIPEDATITKAVLRTVYSQWSDNTHLKISADKQQDPSAPTDNTDLVGRTRTTAGVDMDSGWSDYSWHDSPDFSSVVQELVDSYNYSGGTNAIQILMDDDGSVSGSEWVGTTFDGGYAPQLILEWTTSGVGSGSGGVSPSVPAGADDGFAGSWGYSNSATWFEAGNPGGSTYSTWFRFDDVQIPEDATITKAVLHTVYSQWSDNTHLKISADKQQDPSAPTDNTDLTGRTRTTAGVDMDSGWSDSSWHDSPDFSSVIQELVNSYDYSGGTNAIQILVDDDGSASGSEWVGTTYDGGYAPQLILEWTTPGGGSGYVTLTRTWMYDERGRLVQDTVQDGSTPYTTEYTYDSANRLVTVTYPTGEVVTQTYDDRSLPESLSGTAAGTLVSSTSYNQFGQIKQINLGNGTTTDFNYWGPDHGNGTQQYGKLWQIKTTYSSTTLQDLQYSWDANGNLSSRYDAVASQTETFGYDFLDRLTSVTGAYSNTYTYDEIGNIETMNGVSYTYGTKPHAVTAVGSTSYTYDANGNMTARGSQDITWDEENRPVTIGGTIFVYDGDGNRIKKTESGEVIIYINKYYEKNLTTGEITTHYYLGGKEIAYKNNSGITYVHQDSLGSTVLTTDTSGNTLSTVRYYPYGDCRFSSGSLTTDKLFTGQRLDDTGLYYYNARYYDATIGRFISADSIIPDWTNPQSFNRYSYCLNNPLKYIDPSGHCEYDPETGELTPCNGEDDDDDDGGFWKWTNPKTYYEMSADVVNSGMDLLDSYTRTLTGDPRSVGSSDHLERATGGRTKAAEEMGEQAIDIVNPVPEGHTVGIGLSFQGVLFGGGGSSTFMVVIDGNGGVGLLWGGGPCGGSPSISGALQVQLTNADSINQLRGGTPQVGGTIGTPIGSFGAEGLCGNTYQGFNVMYNPVPWAWEMHAALEFTGVKVLHE